MRHKPEGQPRADATTWVMKDPHGRMARVKVVDMTDQHLHRWIRYFRTKRRVEGFVGSDAQLDVLLRASIVTAPAIYAEAQKRGVVPPPEVVEVPPSVQVPVPSVPARGKPAVVALPGVRRITLDEED